MKLVDSNFRALLLTAICACILIGILAAGLLPFHAPKNEVSWLKQGNGLRFGKHGSILSVSGLAATHSQPDSSCSLEIWLKPSRVDSSGTILAFYLPASPVIPFAMRQSLGDLKLELATQDQSDKKARI
jgi:hypothetical protein